MNRLLVLAASLIVIVFSFSACDKAMSITKPSITEFKELPKGKGDPLSGYRELKQASSVQEVIAKFGNPSKSEDFSNLLAGNGKILYYEAKDEYGNNCYAALKFLNASRDKSAKPDCLMLVDAGTTQLPN